MKTINPKLAFAQKLFEECCATSRQYDNTLASALRQYGAHGVQISGAGREHFPESVKDELRTLARKVSNLSDAAYRARPARVRVATMRKLARHIATRDGAGFYGPQP